MSLGEIAAAAGKGLFAGLVGTAAITASKMLDMKLRGKEQSDAPAEVAGKALGVEPKSEADKMVFANVVHWGYGTAWGIVRGLIAATGIRGEAANAMHFATVWGTALLMLPSAGVAPPPTRWGLKELGLDALHHAVYAAATGTVYELLEEH